MSTCVANALAAHQQYAWALPLVKGKRTLLMTVDIIMMMVSHDDGGVVMLLMRVVKVQRSTKS